MFEPMDTYNHHYLPPTYTPYIDVNTINPGNFSKKVSWDQGYVDLHIYDNQYCFE